MSDERSETPELPGRLAALKLERLGWVRYLLAPVLAAGAAGVHFALNVPNRIQHSPRDQGARPERVDKKKSSRRAVRHVPRTRQQLDQLWANHGEQAFDEEPTNTAWARKFQAHVNKAVVVARNRAFHGAPEPPQVLLAASECRTIRCQLTLRGPFAHEVGLLADTLKTLELGEEGSLWRDFRSTELEPPDDGSPKDHHYVQVTLAFASDDVNPAEIVAPEPEGEADGSGDVAKADPTREPVQKAGPPGG